MAAKGGRGGRRQRRFVKQEQFGPIDRKAISDLLTMLAPDVADDRREMALEIVVKGIELVRDHAPTELRLPPGNAQKNRRALEKLKKGKAEIDLTFNSFMRIGGRLYGVGNTGIYRLEDEPVDRVEVSGLDSAILWPMGAMSMLQQRSAGFQNINQNILYNPPVGLNEDGSERTFGDDLMDGAITPSDWAVRLAAYVYLAITRGLGIRASMAWYEDEPPRQMSKGWNYGRLLVLAAEQANVRLPASRRLVKKLLKKGQDAANAACEVAISYPDGRTFTTFEIEFPEV